MVRWVFIHKNTIARVRTCMYGAHAVCILLPVESTANWIALSILLEIFNKIVYFDSGSQV